MDSADRPVILQGFYLLYFFRFKPQINKIITNAEKKNSRQKCRLTVDSVNSGVHVFSFEFGKIHKPVNMLTVKLCEKNKDIINTDDYIATYDDHQF